MGTVNGRGASEVEKSKTAENTVIFSLGIAAVRKNLPIVKELIEAVDDTSQKKALLDQKSY